MGLDIKSKLVVITGSAGGLGKAFALKLLSLGAKVCISDVNEELGAATAAEMAAQFGEERVAFVACDVTQQESVAELIQAAQRLLHTPLYCFINNAGDCPALGIQFTTKGANVNSRNSIFMVFFFSY